MKKKTFKDYIELQETGLFTEMNKIEPFEWNDLYTPEQLDILLLFKHGNKPLINSLYYVELDTLAKIVYTSYNIKWQKIFKGLVENNDSLNQTYNILTNELVTSDDELIQKGNTTNKVGAFNSEDLISDSGVENNSTIGNNENVERLTEETRVDNNTLIQNIQFLETNLFSDIVLKDISDLILLKVY